VLALALVMSACTNSSTDDGATPTTGTGGDTTLPQFSDPDDLDPTNNELDGPDPSDLGEANAGLPTEADGSSRIESAAEINSPKARSIEALQVDPENDSQLLVSFAGGLLDCNAYRGSVEETDEEILLLVEGGLPVDIEPGVECPEIAVQYTMAVPLEAPEGGRVITLQQPDEIEATWQRIDAETDLSDTRPFSILELIEDAGDPSVILVRFAGTPVPCAGYDITLTETEEVIEVGLVTGSTGESATATCPTVEASYEIAAQLASDAGGRQLIAVPADESTTDNSDEFLAYLGLTLENAATRAIADERPWRITRQDDEIMTLDDDFDENRLNFEVDDDVITAVSLG
jgi:hypothetical protein